MKRILKKSISNNCLPVCRNAIDFSACWVCFLWLCYLGISTKLESLSICIFVLHGNNKNKENNWEITRCWLKRIFTRFQVCFLEKFLLWLPKNNRKNRNWVNLLPPPLHTHKQKVCGLQMHVKKAKPLWHNGTAWNQVVQFLIFWKEDHLVAEKPHTRCQGCWAKYSHFLVSNCWGREWRGNPILKPCKEAISKRNLAL